MVLQSTLIRNLQLRQRTLCQVSYEVRTIGPCQKMVLCNLPILNDFEHRLTLIMTKPFFLRAEHCMGKVSDAPASAEAKS